MLTDPASETWAVPLKVVCDTGNRMVATGCDNARMRSTALCELSGPAAVIRIADTPGERKGPLERRRVLPPFTGEEAGSKVALTAGGKREVEQATTWESPNSSGTLRRSSAVAPAPRKSESCSRTREKSLSIT